MPSFHILAGPPGSAKTSVLPHLAGTCHTVAEPAQQVLAQQRRIDGQGTGDRDPALFVALMLDQAVCNHDAALSAPGPVVVDRGLADLLAYAAYWQLDTSPIDRAIQPVRTPRALPEAFGPFRKEAVYPLADSLAAHAEGFGDGAPACAFLNHTPDHLGSTMGRGSGILMDVHSVCFPGVDGSQHQSPRSGPNGQPIERSQLDLVRAAGIAPAADQPHHAAQV
jgi:hypothetical protein